MSRPARPTALPGLLAGALIALCQPAAAAAPSEGGLYIAGDGFGFEAVAERGIAQNPGGRRFFLLTLAPEADAIQQDAPASLAATRQRVGAANGVLLVCRRDLDSGRIDGSRLVPGVKAARGWPAPGAEALPKGQRYFADEDPTRLPASDEALRRLRATCS